MKYNRTAPVPASPHLRQLGRLILGDQKRRRPII